MKLAEIIKKARKDRRLTIAKVAASVQISVSHLHAIEKGYKPRPKMEVLYKLSAFYNIPIDDICVSCSRIPMDVFYKVATSKEIIKMIREYKV